MTEDPCKHPECIPLATIAHRRLACTSCGQRFKQKESDWEKGETGWSIDQDTKNLDPEELKELYEAD